MSIAGFNDIPITSAETKQIGEALTNCKRAMQLIPPPCASDDVLRRNMADALFQARHNLEQAHGIFEHLLQRAQTCN